MSHSDNNLKFKQKITSIYNYLTEVYYVRKVWTLN